MKNEIELKKIMNDNGLTRAETAELLSVAESTVDAWLIDEKSKHHRNMPNRMLELLILKIN